MYKKKQRMNSNENEHHYVKKEKIQTHNITVYCKSILLAYIN
jgi:hypothetical protein